jgi:hypothetical protein
MSDFDRLLKRARLSISKSHLLSCQSVRRIVFNRFGQLVGIISGANFNAPGRNASQRLVPLVGIVDGFREVDGNIKLSCGSVFNCYERQDFGTPFKTINGFGDLHRAIQEAISGITVDYRSLVHVSSLPLA